MAPVRARRRRLARRRAHRGAVADAARPGRPLPANDPGRLRQLRAGQAAARQVADTRLACACGPRLRTRAGETLNDGDGSVCLPLRAATILAPLSSRTTAPTTTRSHRVERKIRMPSAAV